MVQQYWQDYLHYTGAQPIREKVYLCRHLELTPEYPIEIYTCGEESLIMLSDFLWEGRDLLESYELGMMVEEVLDLFLEGVSYTRDESVFMGLFGDLQEAPLPEGASIRALRPLLDQGHLAALKRSCTQKEAAQGSVSLQDVWPHGVFEGKKLVCAVSTWLWGEKLADLGVITHSEYRRRGYARAAIAYEAALAKGEGKLPLYRCETDNEASFTLAQSLGFEVFVRGQGAVVHYPEEEE